MFLNSGDIQELYDTTLALGHAAAFSGDCDLPSAQDMNRFVGLQVGSLLGGPAFALLLSSLPFPTAHNNLTWPNPARDKGEAERPGGPGSPFQPSSVPTECGAN